jgi:hypothetical protein
MSSVATQTSSSNIESFAALFEESLTRQEMKQGEVITAEIVAFLQHTAGQPGGYVRGAITSGPDRYRVVA